MSQWADQRRKLSSKTSAEPGQWHTSRVPYLREIMDCCSDPRVTEVSWMAAAQVSKTEGIINNTVGYYMDQEPSSIMVVLETEEKRNAWSKERLMPMVLETPCLRDKIDVGRGAGNSNEIGYKDFPGGYLAIVSAGSEASLSSRPIRILLKDEIDKWLQLSAGDPDSLVDKRTSTFTVNKKIINVSTPRDHHPPDATSRIHVKYHASDMRKYYVPCPFCGHEQVLREAQLKFTRPGNAGDIVDEVWYECENPACSIKKIRPLHKYRMLEQGRWIAEKPFAGHAGFSISALYSPWVTWKEYAEAFLKMKRTPSTYKTFVNEWRGEPWDPIMEVDKDISVYTKRCEPYDKVPLGAGILTAFVDVQQNRLECEVKAWGVGRECWGMEHRIFYGEPAMLTTGHLPPVWEELDKYLAEMWEHESGELLRLSRVFIDGRYLTTTVWKFVRPRRGRGIHMSMGMNAIGTPLVSKRPTKTKDKMLYFPIGPNEGKEIVLGNMEIEDDGPGKMHFRKGKYDDEYFKQVLLSERKRYVKGIVVYEKITSSSRNEGLDLCVGNLAAFESMQADPKLYVEALRRSWEEKKQHPAAEPQPVSIVEKPKQKNNLPRRHGSWATGWRG